MTQIKYRLKQKFQDLSKKDYDIAMKMCHREIGISDRTFQRDLNSVSEDIPHFRIVQYAKFLGCNEVDLEGFEREEIQVRSFKEIKAKAKKSDLAFLKEHGIEL